MAVSNKSASIPHYGRVLSIDPGSKRIGIAISDPSQTIAQPLATLSRRAGKRFPLQQLRSSLEEYEPVGIVMGLPIAPDGAEDERAKIVRDIGAMLSGKTGLPVEYWDERMTTARALSTIQELGGRVRGRKEDVDGLAATVLLQTFLDSRRR
jgi:putative Holliday junction resolvase